ATHAGSATGASHGTTQVHTTIQRLRMPRLAPIAVAALASIHENGENTMATLQEEQVAYIPDGELHRTIGWTHAFWVASGVPALVLFSIGAIAATVGNPSALVWFISVTFGFLQA